MKRDPSLNVPNWDEALEINYDASIAAKREQLEDLFVEQTLRIESGEDFTYQEYLRSEEWRRKRALVLERDKHQCQGCLSAEATEVHHLNYDDVPDEMMFDLVSLCSACHKKVHRKKLARLEKLNKAEGKSASK